MSNWFYQWEMLFNPNPLKQVHEVIFLWKHTKLVITLCWFLTTTQYKNVYCKTTTWVDIYVLPFTFTWLVIFNLQVNFRDSLYLEVFFPVLQSSKEKRPGQNLKISKITAAIFATVWNWKLIKKITLIDICSHVTLHLKLLQLN